MSNRVDVRENIKRFLNTNLILITIIIFAFAIRVYFFRNTEFENVQDSYWLAKLAKGILNGNYTIGGRFHHAVEPLYPFLIRIFTFITGDYLLSGKIISLLFGTATIPVIYLFWKKLESEEVAILAALLVSINYVAWQMSLHVFRDSLFLFLCSLSFLLCLMALEDLKWMSWLAVSLGLATLARSEGFALALSIGLSIFILNKGALLFHKKTKKDLEKFRAFKKSAFIFILVSLPWYFYAYIQTKEVIPFHVLWEVQRGGSLGLRWVSVVKNLSTMPLFTLAILGIALTLKRKEEYLPFYLFVVLFSIPHMWFSGGAAYPRYALPLLPLILGWAAIALIAIISSFLKETPKLKIVFLFLILLFFFSQSFRIIKETETKPEPFEVIKDAMLWFNANSEEGATILVGDEPVYGYYSTKTVIDSTVFSTLYNRFENHTEAPHLSLLISENIHYVVGYDSVMPWYYYYNPFFMIKKEFNEKEHYMVFRYIFPHRKIEFSEEFKNLRQKGYTWNTRMFISTQPYKLTITFAPLKKFERNNQKVYLYRVDWE